MPEKLIILIAKTLKLTEKEWMAKRFTIWQIYIEKKMARLVGMLFQPNLNLILAL